MKIKIAGELRDIEITYYASIKIMKRYNKIYNALHVVWLNQWVSDNRGKYSTQENYEIAKANEWNEHSNGMVIPNWFFFWALWKLIKGNKYFKSRKHMEKNILRSEVQGICDLIGNNVLRHNDG